MELGHQIKMQDITKNLNTNYLEKFSINKPNKIVLLNQIHSNKFYFDR